MKRSTTTNILPNFNLQSIGRDFNLNGRNNNVPEFDEYSLDFVILAFRWQFDTIRSPCIEQRPITLQQKITSASTSSRRI